jgi:hypothetical protein
MRRFDPRKSRLAAFLIILVIAIVIVYVAGPLENRGGSSLNTSSSTGSGTGTSTAKGAEETNGPASFVGHASNAVMFIQWTRSGQNVIGSLREAIKKAGSLGLESTDKSFTGVIDGKGLTLTLQAALGETSSLVGELKEPGFMLTLPGRGSSLITVAFEPGEVSGYNEATKQLVVGQYPSPCSLYVSGHEVRVSFTGSNAAEECASFVQKTGNTEWTTAPQTAAEEAHVVCEVQNRSNEKATVTDGGGQSYGKEACTQLSGEGWG